MPKPVITDTRVGGGLSDGADKWAATYADLQAVLDWLDANKATDHGTLTQAEIDALTPGQNDIVYNSTAVELQYYNGSSWTAFGTGSGSGGLPAPVDLAAGTALSLNTAYYATFDAPRTLTISGTPSNGDKIELDAVVSVESVTLTIPESYQYGGLGNTTEVTLLQGTHLLQWKYVDSLWKLADTGTFELPDNSVGTDQLQDEAVTISKLPATGTPNSAYGYDDNGDRALITELGTSITIVSAFPSPGEVGKWYYNETTRQLARYITTLSYELSAAFTIVDNDPPVLFNIDSSVVSGTEVDLSVDTSDATGTLYTVVVDSAVEPSEDQIIAGTDASDVAADFATSQSVTAEGTQDTSVTGLSPSTTYNSYQVHVDAAGNRSNIINTSFFTTSTGLVLSHSDNAQDTTVSAGTNTFTIDIGAASGDRQVIIGLVADDYNSFTFSNFLINGVAPHTVQTAVNSGSATKLRSVLMVASVPSGSGLVSFSYDASVALDWAAVGVWTLYGAKSTVLDSVTDANSEPLEATITTVDGGCAILIGCGSDPVSNYGQGDFQQDFDRIVLDDMATGGSLLTTGSSASARVDDMSGGGYGSMVAMSFEPL